MSNDFIPFMVYTYGYFIDGSFYMKYFKLQKTFKLYLLGIPGFPPGMPYGFVRIFFLFILFFFFFRRQGFRMITFDRQAGPLQNFNRSHMSWP